MLPLPLTPPYLSKAAAFLLLLIAFMDNKAFGQKSYFTVRVSYSIRGSSPELKKGMTTSGYPDQPEGGWFLFGPPRDYPYAEKYPSVSIEWGKHTSERRSYSIEAGLEEPGKAGGYSRGGGGYFYINHMGWLLHPKINFHGPNASFGVGPALLHYTYNSNSRVLPGVGLSTDFFSNRSKKVKLTVFGALHLYTGFTTRTLPASYIGLEYKPVKVNPSNLQLGVAFRFH